MQKHTRYFILIALTFFVVIGSFSAKAQPPTKVDRSSAEYAQRLRENTAEQKRMRDNEDQRANAKHNQSTPNTPSSGSGTKYRFEIARDKQAQKEQFERESKEKAVAYALKKRLDDEDKARRKVLDEKEWEESRKKAKDHAEMMKMRDEFMKKSVTDYKGPLSPKDNADLSRDIVYAWRYYLTRDKEQTEAIETFNSLSLGSWHTKRKNQQIFV